jgi:ketosteroid isomerase-like protein
MADDRRVAIAQDFIQKALRGDLDAVAVLLDPAVTYRVPGTNHLAGRFVGLQPVLEHLVQLRAYTEGVVDFAKWEDWMVGVNHVSLLVDIFFQHLGGQHTFRAIFLLEFTEDDLIRSVEVYFSDLAEADRFFSVTERPEEGGS